ncbi:hypothetical protein EYF80_036476 [Liparis tanakae]|uniref:Uncharacterized protein n=1 Tax=Liparis tanakae TaxID=230148 RepID=A0A4Z2GKV3_9TELE|nr:hypothetical protein EYF80_036476 [Liparis tanakae]
MVCLKLSYRVFRDDLSAHCPGAVGSVWSGLGPASPAHWDSERGWSLSRCPPAPAESSSEEQTIILCSSSRLHFNMPNFPAKCSASSRVSARPSSSRLSLCMVSSDRASTFSSISSSMFCSSRRREASSDMSRPSRHTRGGGLAEHPPTPAGFPQPQDSESSLILGTPRLLGHI